jgi:hypothetical protein
VAWGDNTYGQSTVPAGLTNVAGVAAGRYFSLALKDDGTVVAWGSNSYNQTNTPGTVANVVVLAGGGFQVLAIESDGSPTLTAQPVSQAVRAGANVVYAAMAVGTQPMGYQWQCNGTNIPGATAAVLSLANVQLGDAGAYAVTVSNTLGRVISDVATLIMLAPPPGILSAPVYGANGVYQFNVAGTAGSNYVIASSTNLTDWIPLETNTSPFTFTDPNAVKVPWQFYRAQPWP